MTPTTPRPDSVTRRTFVQTTAAGVAALAIPGWPAHAQREEPIRIGLIGCGGRGTGAARDCLRAADGVELVALGDLFPDRLTNCRESLARIAAENPALGARITVDDAHAFTGFDAYEKVITSGVDLVLIATPPAFRPRHVAAAVDARKHVFMEKPVAVDPAGVRSILASSEKAARQGLAIGAGTQRRHDPKYRATIERLHGGAIGDVIAGQVYWNQGGLWMHPRKAEWSDAEWQIRNWLYFTWLSGDHIVEQHMHNLDVANWVLGAHPVKAVGVGGRQWRTDPAYGHVYDHFAVDYEYPNGVRITSMCRQIDGTAAFVGERFAGTTGRTDASGVIEGTSAWRFEAPGDPVNPYVQEHADLIASIRAGRPLNEGRQVAESTLTAILGREAAYTGAELTWDEVLMAEQSLVPEHHELGALPVAPVAVPGVTMLARSA
jgi:myo-inositol 2-dehydrogenase / D-chiro-inositol 1-dehydrogenase